jgi:hypothetical protein
LIEPVGDAAIAEGVNEGTISRSPLPQLLKLFRAAASWNHRRPSAELPDPKTATKNSFDQGRELNSVALASDLRVRWGLSLSRISDFCLPNQRWRFDHDGGGRAKLSALIRLNLCFAVGRPVGKAAPRF